MKSRGKKMIAIMLSLIMMIPLLLSQTSTTAAAAKTTKDVLELKLDASSSTTFTRGDKVVLNVNAKDAISASKIGFNLKFNDASGNTLSNAFTVSKVTVKSGWFAGYDTTNLQFNFSSNNTQNLALNDTIAQIELIVQKEITNATAVMTFDSKSIDIYLASDNSKVTSASPADDVTLALTSSLTGSRGIELALPATQDQTIFTFSSVGNMNLREFSVPVTLTKNTGFNAVTIQFEYDNMKMSYKGYDLSPKALLYLNCITEFQGVTTNPSTGALVGYVSLSFAGVDDTKMTGDFLTLNFEVNSSAKDGDTATLTPKITEVENASETAGLTGTANACTINFKKGYERGDVNRDHQINLLDVTYALQFYNGVRSLTTEQQALADVNGDGKVTLVDVLMLLKKCNGETVTFA